MSQQSSDDSSASSAFTKTLGILVVIFILAVVIYKLASSPEEPEISSEAAPIAATEEVDTHAEEASSEAAAAAEAPQTGDDTQALSNESAESPEPTTATSTQDKKEINQFIEDWKSAWQKSAGPNGNIEAYFSLYADDFMAGTLTKEKWQKSKKIRNQGKSWIEVWVSELSIKEVSADSYRVTFKQEYSSSNYSDKSTKELLVHKNGQNWQIVSEKTL